MEDKDDKEDDRCHPYTVPSRQSHRHVTTHARTFIHRFQKYTSAVSINNLALVYKYFSLYLHRLGW